ncbi:MAG: hypothetical protein KJ621_21045 [Proteobacteria bacterium]|nr:hypothetical protein [Pseudomonadota bacterium]MBU1740745.1 hypothetical protein [Pseudomonadota bacterium]
MAGLMPSGHLFLFFDISNSYHVLSVLEAARRNTLLRVAVAMLRNVAPDSGLFYNVAVK